MGEGSVNPKKMINDCGHILFFEFPLFQLIFISGIILHRDPCLDTWFLTIQLLIYNFCKSCSSLKHEQGSFHLNVVLQLPLRSGK